jgi:hypothetical protein
MVRLRTPTARSGRRPKAARPLWMTRGTPQWQRAQLRQHLRSTPPGVGQGRGRRPGPFVTTSRWLHRQEWPSAATATGRTGSSSVRHAGPSTHRGQPPPLERAGRPVQCLTASLIACRAPSRPGKEHRHGPGRLPSSGGCTRCVPRPGQRRRRRPDGVVLRQQSARTSATSQRRGHSIRHNRRRQRLVECLGRQRVRVRCEDDRGNVVLGRQQRRQPW